jgi:DNA-binding response OmpR family regulator
MSGPGPRAASIMLVDDTPENLRLLEGMLREQGMAVRSFPRARLALASAAQHPPDLVLLDIRMPEMDGFEACRRFKADPRLAGIPILFLSALMDPADKVKAFGCGGVDYVTKPYEMGEVLARVETQLKLSRLQKDLEQHNARLDEEVRARTRQLAEAQERLAILDRAKSEFLDLISHELRTPLHGLFGVGELLFAECPDTGSTRELKDLFEQAQRRLLAIVDDALLLTQVHVGTEAAPEEVAPLGRTLRLAADAAAEFARGRGVAVEVSPSVDSRKIRGESSLMTRAFQALVETAVKFAARGSVVRLSTGARAGDPEVLIEATGRGIPPGALPRFFEVLAIKEAITPGGDLGLAPALAQRILAVHGGRVSVENLHPPGVRFSVRAQVASPPPPAPASHP